MIYAEANAHNNHSHVNVSLNVSHHVNLSQEVSQGILAAKKIIAEAAAKVHVHLNHTEVNASHNVSNVSAVHKHHEANVHVNVSEVAHAAHKANVSHKVNASLNSSAEVVAAEAFAKVLFNESSQPNVSQVHSKVNLSINASEAIHKISKIHHNINHRVVGHNHHAVQVEVPLPQGVNVSTIAKEIQNITHQTHRVAAAIHKNVSKAASALANDTAAINTAISFANELFTESLQPANHPHLNVSKATQVNASSGVEVNVSNAVKKTVFSAKKVAAKIANGVNVQNVNHVNHVNSSLSAKLAALAAENAKLEQEIKLLEAENKTE